MGKLGKILLGGAAIGLTCALAYKYLKTYQELTPETEIGEDGKKRAFTKIDGQTAKEAAKKTAIDIKDGAVKAWNTTVDATKAASGVVKENYAEEIEEAKEKTDAMKEKAVELKDKAASKYDEVKDKAVTKYSEFKADHPKFADGVDKAKESVKGAYETVVEKFSAKTSEETVDGEYSDVTDDAQEFAEDVAEAATETVEAPTQEEVFEDIKNQAGDFVQDL